MLKALTNVRIYDYEHCIDNGYVIFDEKIHEVGEMKDFKNNFYLVINGKGKLVLPNFVCAHSHIYSIFARGLSLPFNPTNFQEILDQMWWKLDSKIDNKITYYSGIAAGYEFLLNGVTTIIDHHASGTDIIGSLSSLRKALFSTLKLRGIYCFESSDRYDIDKCIKENVSFAKKYQDEYSSGLFGMHASMSLSDKSLEKIAKKQENLPIHIHVAESEMDIIDCREKFNTTIVERLDKYNLIKKDSLLVHCVFTSEEELKIIKDREAYVVINPTSNLNNAVGISDLKVFSDLGVKVMIGNDGLSSSMTTEYLNAYYLGHYYNDSPTALSLGVIIDCINNAYDYAGRRLGIKLGKIAPNYVSDFMLVDYTPFTQINENNIFGHIFFGLFPNFKPNDVYVGGAKLVKNGEVTSSKVNRALKEAKTYSDELWSRLK